jgi:hypothetical protein
MEPAARRRAQRVERCGNVADPPCDDDFDRIDIARASSSSTNGASMREKHEVITAVLPAEDRACQQYRMPRP